MVCIDSGVVVPREWTRRPDAPRFAANNMETKQVDVTPHGLKEGFMVDCGGAGWNWWVRRASGVDKASFDTGIQRSSHTPSVQVSGGSGFIIAGSHVAFRVQRHEMVQLATNLVQMPYLW